MLKLLLAALLLTVTAFGHSTVSYSWTAPDCSGITDPFAQWASGCAWSKLKVVANSEDPHVTGFYVVVRYGLQGWGDKNVLAATTFTKDSDGNLVATFMIGDPGSVQILSVTALELISGDTAFAP